ECHRRPPSTLEHPSLREDRRGHPRSRLRGGALRRWRPGNRRHRSTGAVTSDVARLGSAALGRLRVGRPKWQRGVRDSLGRRARVDRSGVRRPSRSSSHRATDPTRATDPDASAGSRGYRTRSRIAHRVDRGRLGADRSRRIDPRRPAV
ncbi:MAG: hypothetical protein AVDCRST_MAG73-2454, partial [uncultured Thermomicrobiales bacterium]